MLINRIFTFLYFLSLVSYSYPLKGNLEDLYAFIHKSKPYQDVIVNNKLFYKSWNSEYCHNRYRILHDIFNDLGIYGPDKSVLDIGAAQGYFSFKLAEDFLITPVMLEDGQSALEHSLQGIPLLKRLLMFNSRICNSTLIESSITHQSLSLLRSQAHFDVVIAFNILHFFDDWQTVLDDLIGLGKTIIIELPSTDGDILQIKNSKHLAAMHERIQSKNGVLIKRIPRNYKNQIGNIYIVPRESAFCQMNDRLYQLDNLSNRVKQEDL